MDSLEENTENTDSINLDHLFDDAIDQMHHKDLGLHVPNDYFFTSKSEMLDATIHTSKGVMPFVSKRRIIWSAAAVIACALSFTFYEKETFQEINETPSIVSDTIELLLHDNIADYKEIAEESDILVTTLFIEDSEIDEFIESYVTEEIFNDENPLN